MTFLSQGLSETLSIRSLRGAANPIQKRPDLSGFQVVREAGQIIEQYFCFTLVRTCQPMLENSVVARLRNDQEAIVFTDCDAVCVVQIVE